MLLLAVLEAAVLPCAQGVALAFSNAPDDPTGYALFDSSLHESPAGEETGTDPSPELLGTRTWPRQPVHVIDPLGTPRFLHELAVFLSGEPRGPPSV
jgi:hypothetical protein